MKKIILLGILVLSISAFAGHLEDGNFYFENGELEKAEKEYLKAAENGNAKALYQLGCLYFEQGRLDKAETFFLKAVDRNIPEAMNELGLLYYDKKEFDKAKKYFKMGADAGDEYAIQNYRKMLEQELKHQD